MRKFAAFLALLATGCASMQPAYVRPDSAVPTSWPVGDVYLRQSEAALPAVTYRDIFRDPRLQALIEQALFNVMENAAKFSPPGQAIRVLARRLDDGMLGIDTIDQGPGIPEDERRRIFDMFYSVERGDRGKHGTGLGLTIVQGILGAHMGRVEALPGPDGVGTTIRLALPLE